MASRALARIHAVSLLTRSDKRKDRVEIAPEQLHLAACAAEVLLVSWIDMPIQALT